MHEIGFVSRSRQQTYTHTQTTKMYKSKINAAYQNFCNSFVLFRYCFNNKYWTTFIDAANIDFLKVYLTIHMNISIFIRGPGL